MNRNVFLSVLFSCVLLPFLHGAGLAMGKRAPIVSTPGPSTPRAESEPVTAAPSGEKHRPNIVFAEKDFDFGEAKDLSKVEHVFKFRNEGDADLKIEKVKSTCGCTAALLSSKLIPPGGDGEVKTTFRFGSREGKQLKHVYVYSNDPEEPKIRLSISGVIIPPVKVEPRSVHFFDTKAGPAKRIKISQTMEEELELKEPKTRLDLVESNLYEMPRENGKRRYILEISAKPNLQPGRYFEHVTIGTNIKTQPEIKIPVRINVRGDIEAAPARLNLGAILPGKEITREVTLSNRKRTPFRIVKVEIDNKAVSTALKTPTEPSASHRIDLRIAAKKQSGAMRAKIVFHTDYEPQKKIEVNAYGYVQKQPPPTRAPVTRRKESNS